MSIIFIETIVIIQLLMLLHVFYSFSMGTIRTMLNPHMPHFSYPHSKWALMPDILITIISLFSVFISVFYYFETELPLLKKIILFSLLIFSTDTLIIFLIPEKQFLQRVFKRNSFYMLYQHPLLNMILSPFARENPKIFRLVLLSWLFLSLVSIFILTALN